MADLHVPADDRLIVGAEDFEDAAVVRLPAGKALVQTVDFFTPIVNDPFAFGQIAAANALSDVYAMGGEPLSVMNIVCFPIKTAGPEELKAILKGGLDKIVEAGAVLAGGHSVEDDEIKYGLAVSGLVDPDRIATNKGVRSGDQLVLTKPLGTGVLATALKAKWTGSEAMEQALIRWAGRLNKGPGQVIREMGIKGATDITGFGLGGHLLEMARASHVSIDLVADKVPMLDQARELVGMGMLPAGSFANRRYCEGLVKVKGDIDPITVDLIFDAQTSGGMLLAVPEDRLSFAIASLEEKGEMAVHIGQAVPSKDLGTQLLIR